MLNIHVVLNLYNLRIVYNAQEVLRIVYNAQGFVRIVYNAQSCCTLYTMRSPFLLRIVYNAQAVRKVVRLE